MLKRLSAVLFLLFCHVSPAWAWEVWKEQEPGYPDMVIAEVVGDLGNFLRLVCINQSIHLEITLLGSSESLNDAFLSMQVDENPPVRVAGFLESFPEAEATVFFGLDRRDRPAPTTEELLYQMLEGYHLYLLDLETHEPLEHWSMAGSIKAVRLLGERCSDKPSQAQSA